jgi:hypothetical protein
VRSLLPYNQRKMNWKCGSSDRVQAPVPPKRKQEEFSSASNQKNYILTLKSQEKF